MPIGGRIASLSSTPRDPRVAAVAAQYERHPYPPFSPFLRPSRALGHPLAYELGQQLRTGRFVPHDETTRILVAGGGTIEAITAARVHPHAQITALDLSRKSLRRTAWNAWLGGSRGRLKLVQADLHEDLSKSLGGFDYILCTGVLHHSPNPEQLFANLARLLRPEGVLRLMMYPARSRLHIYALKNYFHSEGLGPETPGLLRKTQSLVHGLAAENPLRLAFEAYSDHRHTAGLIDGFFHAWDVPIEIPRLATMATTSSLSLLGFGHAWHSQPIAFLKGLKTNPEISRRYRELSPWLQLHVLDCFLELAVNPVFWLSASPLPVKPALATRAVLNPALEGVLSPVKAPLVEPEGDELYSTFEPSRLAERREAYLRGGCLLSDESTLPPELLSQRAESFKSADISVRSLSRPAARADLRETVLSSVDDGLKLWLGADASAALRDEARAHLARVLEPRVSPTGKPLPYLSAGDYLRESR